MPPLTALDRTIADNYASVRSRMELACRRAGRPPDSVQLVAVTKYAELDWVRALLQLGVVDLGENRPQQLAERARQLPENVRWHLIGPLQRNKVRATLPLVKLIHSVDSLRLLEAIDRIAGELNLRPRVLIEVNFSGEAAKHGFRADELEESWARLIAFGRVEITGLMTMAAYSDNAEDARPVFKALSALRNRLEQRANASSEESRARAGPKLTELSMGMSGDFEVAIEEGATLVRIGSALWEGLQ